MSLGPVDSGTYPKCFWENIARVARKMATIAESFISFVGVANDLTESLESSDRDCSCARAQMGRRRLFAGCACVRENRFSGKSIHGLPHVCNVV